MSFFDSINSLSKKKKKGRSVAKHKLEVEDTTVGGNDQPPGSDEETCVDQPLNVQGSIVSLSAQELSGWAEVQEHPESSVELLILMDGQVVGETSTSGPAAGDPPSNFNWAITPELMDGRVHTFVVQVKATGQDLDGSGLKILLPVDQQKKDIPRRRGTVAVSGKWITGWAVDTSIAQPLHVILKVNGKEQGEMLAGQYGAHLETDEYPYENKHTCFLFPTPEGLYDGFHHTLQVIVREWGNQQLPRMTIDFIAGTIVGCVDSFNPGGVSGWIGFRETPAELLPITLFLDGNPIAQARLTKNRQDVVNARICPEAYGFDIKLPLPTQGCLEVRYDRYALRNSRYECKRTNDYQGRFDAVTRDVISGWAVDLNNSADMVDLALVIDGHIYTKFKPNKPRPDVNQHFNIDANNICGFGLPTPEILLDGEEHVVFVSFAESGKKLKIGNSDEVTCKFPLNFEKLPSATPFPVLSTFIPQLDSAACKPVTRETKPDVSLIVLNRNGEEILGALFESFLATNRYPSYEFVVVDHASTDKSLDVIDEWAKLIPIKKVCLDYNGSFSASNNLAARDYTQADVLLFLNNDIIFVHDVLTEMMAEIKRSQQIGMLGIKLLDIVEDQGINFNPPVQHLGVRFKLFSNARILPYDEKLNPYTAHTCYHSVPSAGVTGAVMMVRREEFLSIGGFHEDYFYGYEDVDLFLQYRINLGKEVVCLNQLQALHHRGYSRLSGRELGVFQGLNKNHSVLMERFGYAIRRLHRKSQFKRDGVYASEPLRIAFAVTETGDQAEAGDYFTALELARELAKYTQVEPVFLSERNDWYHAEHIHVLVVMRHDFDLRSLRQARGDLLTVAWMRNHFEAWEKQQCFVGYDLYASSSRRHAEGLTQKGFPCAVLPIATTPETMTGAQPCEEFACHVAFNGSAWAVQRDVATAVELLAKKGINTAVFGSGWGGTAVEPSYRGFVPYAKMPEIYASTLIVLDDANPSARAWGSANSRVFDALAAGRLVLSNSRAASEDFFDGLLPVWDTPQEAAALAEHYLTNPEEREALTEQLQQQVLSRHTYANRARDFMALIENYAVKSLRIAIKTPVPSHEEKPWWGDWHFAESLAAALKAQGHSVRIDILPEWETANDDHVDDAVIVLRGLSEYKPSPEHLNFMWLISHPEKITIAEMKQYNHVFVASEKYSRQLQSLGVSASTLLQCTDGKRMKPLDDGSDAEAIRHEHLFVGNSRGKRRKIVDELVQSDYDLAIYGRDWMGLVPGKFIKDECIANADVHRYYSAAGIVYNDHWPDMAENGFLSNRLFDAAACGAYVISDFAEGLAETFEGLIPGCRNKEDLINAINAASNEEFRRKVGAALRALVLSKHTFDHRAQTLLAMMLEADAAQTGQKSMS